MLWIFAILLVLACLGVLLFGMRRPPSGRLDADAARSFFRDQLDGIDRDVASGRMKEDEADAARAELAREVMRHEKEQAGTGPIANSRTILLATLPVVAVAALGLYAVIGRAGLPSQPLAEREIAQANLEMTLDDAVASVEAQLAETPNDVRGWLVLAPVYLRQERFAEAAHAWRRILDLEPPTATRQTNLAEALILANGGMADAEAMELLHSAVAGDPTGVRQRLYLAGQLTDQGEYAEAVPLWQETLDLATGDEPWIGVAGSGLAAAQAGMASTMLGEGEPDATLDVMIRGMVEGLAARIADEGGSASEWMQLVRSRQQIDGDDAARDDLERGLAALAGDDRLALEDLARELGLTEQ